MITIRQSIYIIFLIALSIWFGGGVFDSVSGHFAWYADPVTYVRGSAVGPEGMVNPWPFTTAFLALATLASIAAFAFARHPGRRAVLIANSCVVLALIATGVYFVPVLIKLGDPTQLTDPEIISYSQTWIRLNLVRLVFLLLVFAYALVALMRLGTPVRNGA
jgi:hypothetical protein